MDIRTDFRKKLAEDRKTLKSFAEEHLIEYQKLHKWLTKEDSQIRNKIQLNIIQNYTYGYSLPDESKMSAKEPKSDYDSRYVALLEDDRKSLQQNLNQALEALNVGLKQLVANSAAMSESQLAMQAQLQASIIREAQKHAGDSPAAVQEELTRVNKLVAEALQGQPIRTKGKSA